MIENGAAAVVALSRARIGMVDGILDVPQGTAET